MPNFNDLTNQKFGLLKVLYKIKKNNRIYWHCICECGNIVNVSGRHLRANHTLSCGCLKASYGAQQIEKFLIQLKISYEKEKTFPTLKNPKTGKSLRFDFYLPILNTVIEYDGEQHFKKSPILKEYQYRDNIKNQWCKNNNIKLIRISYKNLKQININYLCNLLNR